MNDRQGVVEPTVWSSYEVAREGAPDNPASGSARGNGGVKICGREGGRYKLDLALHAVAAAFAAA
ncbi:MAG: hypothetical protein ACRD3J_03660, partial [Thermoanaerobaculia bacterium]